MDHWYPDDPVAGHPLGTAGDVSGNNTKARQHLAILYMIIQNHFLLNKFLVANKNATI